MSSQEKDHTPLSWTARIISLLLHPLWLPLVYATWKCWGDPLLPKLLMVITACLVIFPGLVALLWMWVQRETDWFVMSQGNRAIPLAAGLIGMAFFAVANGALLPDRLFQGELMAILTLLLIISILVTFFWKISIHLLSWGAVDVFTLDAQQWPLFILTLLLTLLVAWARMRVRSHDLLQITVGWGAGAAAAGVVLLTFP